MYNAAFVLNGGSEAVYESIPGKFGGLVDVPSAATGVMVSTFIAVDPGAIISKVCFSSGTTALGTPTHWGFALHSAAGVLLGQTADQTNTAWAAYTAMDLALQTQVVVTGNGVYASVWQVATTPATLLGQSSANLAANNATITGQVAKLSQSSGSGIVAVAPNIVSGTTLAGRAYAVIH